MAVQRLAWRPGPDLRHSLGDLANATFPRLWLGRRGGAVLDGEHDLLAMPAQGKGGIDPGEEVRRAR